MAPVLDISSLRAAAPPEQAALLRTAIAAPGADIAVLTEQLLNSIGRRCIASQVVQTWLSITLDPYAAAATLRQSHSAVARRIAIPYLRRHFRGVSTFARMWDAVGGARGLADIMAQLSVQDLRKLCVALGSTALAGSKLRDGGNVRAERQRRMTELFQLLCDDTRNPETRPLRDAYAPIVPACTIDEALQWAERASVKETQLKSEHTVLWRVRIAHHTAFEKLALEDAFVKAGERVDLDRLVLLSDNSLDFGMQVLGKFAECDTLRGVSAKSFITWLALPLVRRCARRCSKDNHNRALKLLNACLQKHAVLRAELGARSYEEMDKGVLDYAVQGWRPSASRPYDDEILTTFIGFLPATQPYDDDIAAFIGLVPGSRRCDDLADMSLVTPDTIDSHVLASLLRLVPPSLRYRLLRLLLHHCPKYGFDIGPVSSTESKMLAGIVLESTIFTCLPAAEGIALFERVLEANPSLSFLSFSSSHRICSILDEYADREPDVDVLRALLIQRANGQNLSYPKGRAAFLERMRTGEVTSRKKMAMQGREPEERINGCKKALRLCVALDDLDLYAETLIWARRYNKDPLTIKKLYGEDTMGPVEALNMLYVLPEKRTQVADVPEKIQKANRVLMLLLETATMALREPSFDEYDWLHVLELIPNVAERRLERMGAFQKHTALSDEALDGILQPTLEMIVQAETLLLKPEHSRLRKQTRGGTLHSKNLSPDGAPKQPLVRFLDRLARARDGLWEKARVRSNPSVVTLEAPWPRGLPVHCLLPAGTGICLDIPYINERAEAVVFCDPKVALAPAPDDLDTQIAISLFFESWADALKLYVDQAEDKATRAQRIYRAWVHATEKLNGDRMSSSEARRVWEPVFSRVGLKPDIDNASGTRLPALPSEDPGQPSEWDPVPFRAVKVLTKDRRIDKLTCIDCMREMQNSARGYDDDSPTSLENMFKTLSDVKIPGTPELQAFWHHHLDRGMLKDATIDAYVAAAVLVWNSKYGSDASLLMQPFPDKQNVRFPAIYLDQDFLEQQKGNVDGTLQRFVSFAPPEILEKLATSMLQRIRTEKDENRRDYRHWRLVVRLLLRSDNPSAACPLIERLILEHPEASAWHRQLLHAGMLRKLEPKAVEQLLVSLSRSMIERLRSQAADGSSKTSTESQVKITTVKLLAQLLLDTSCVDPRVAVGILGELVANVTHPDLRIATIDSLVAAYRNTNAKAESTSELKTHILSLLRTHAVPYAAVLNWRSPEKETDWKEAENGGSLPTISETVLDHAWDLVKTAPALQLLLDDSDKKSPQLVKLAYAAMEISAEKNRRWMTLFLRKHGFTLADDILPLIPTYPSALLKAVWATDYSKLPLETFETIRGYVLLLFDPPQALADITNAVRKNAELARSNEGKHWLRLWDKHPLQATEMGGVQFARSLKWFAALDDDGKSGPLKYDRVEAFVMDMAETLLGQGEVATFNRLIDCIHPEFDTPDGFKKGPRYVMRRLIERIDSMRTPEWQADRNRQPSVLPKMLPSQLKLLVAPKKEAPPEHISLYTSRVIVLLDSIVETATPYHERYLSVESATCNVSQKLEVAALLGSPSRLHNAERPTLVDHLRVKVSSALLRRTGNLDGKDSAISTVRVMIQEWEDSAAEEFRDVARSLRGKFAPVRPTS